MKDLEQTSPKQLIYVFELDNCIANSKNFMLTNKEAFKKDKKLLDKCGIGFRGKLTEQNENDLSEAYLADHQLEIKPNYGLLDLFVRLSKSIQCAIIISRSMLLKQTTIDWLERSISNIYGYQTWRQISYKLYFNEFDEKELVYKKQVLAELDKQYDINLLITNDKLLSSYASKLNINCLLLAKKDNDTIQKSKRTSKTL